VIKAHQHGRDIEIERIVDALMDTVPRRSGERTFEEQSLEAMQQKIDQLTETEKEVLVECGSYMTDITKNIIKRQRASTFQSSLPNSTELLA